MALDVQQVTAMVFVRRMPEMVETNAEHIGQRREAGDMAAEVAIGTIGPHHHGHRVPAHVRAQTLFIFEVARAMLAEMRRNGVHIRGIAGERDVRATAAREIHHALEQVVRTFRAFVLDHRLKCVKPLAGFHYIGIVGGLRQNVVDLRCHEESPGFLSWPVSGDMPADSHYSEIWRNFNRAEFIRTSVIFQNTVIDFIMWNIVFSEPDRNTL